MRVVAQLYMYVPEEVSKVVSELVLTALLTPSSVMELVPSLLITVVVSDPNTLLLHWKLLVATMSSCVVAVQTREMVL